MIQKRLETACGGSSRTRAAVFRFDAADEWSKQLIDLQVNAATQAFQSCVYACERADEKATARTCCATSRSHHLAALCARQWGTCQLRVDKSLRARLRFILGAGVRIFHHPKSVCNAKHLTSPLAQGLARHLSLVRVAQHSESRRLIANAQLAARDQSAAQSSCAFLCFKEYLFLDERASARASLMYPKDCSLDQIVAVL